VLGLGQVVHAGRDTLARVDKVVHARRQYALETTVAIQQAALAVADHDLLDPEHVDTPSVNPCFDPSDKPTASPDRYDALTLQIIGPQKPLPRGIIDVMRRLKRIRRKRLLTIMGRSRRA